MGRNMKGTCVHTGFDIGTLGMSLGVALEGARGIIWRNSKMAECAGVLYAHKHFQNVLCLRVVEHCGIIHPLVRDLACLSWVEEGSQLLGMSNCMFQLSFVGRSVQFATAADMERHIP